MDPFWFSQQPNGGCNEGAFAKNLTSSPFSFPRGLRAVGVPMMLFLQGFSDQNVYNASYAFAGQSVAPNQAEKFFAERYDCLELQRIGL